MFPDKQRNEESNMDVQEVLKYGTRLLIVFMCIPVHEFAHAWAATKLGDETPRMQGRLTLNPIAHFDIIGGLGILLGGFGWGKPVQVNPMRFDHKHNMRAGMAITAAAGPISNIIMAFAGTIIYKFIYGALLSHSSEVLAWLMVITFYFIHINLGLAVFNLVPVPPLDGQKIVEYFLPDNVVAKIKPYEMYISIGIIGLIVFTNILNPPLEAAANGLYFVMDKLTFWVDPIVNALF